MKSSRFCLVVIVLLLYALLRHSAVVWSDVFLLCGSPFLQVVVVLVIDMLFLYTDLEKTKANKASMSWNP